MPDKFHHIAGFLPFILLGLWLFVLSEVGGFSWVFQSPTYLLEKDTLGLASYTCDTSQTACRVNFDFTPSVPTVEPSTHYVCLIDFGFGVTGQENKCNPTTVEFPIGTWNVALTVKKIADESVVQSGTIQIVHPDGSIDPLRVTFTREWQSPTYLLSKEDSSLTEYVCDPAETDCKMNLLVTPKLDGNTSSLLMCEITSDFELISTTDPCNPNTSIIPVGDHILTIKILDKAKGTLLQTSTITLKNAPKDTTIDPARVTFAREWQSPTYLLSKEDTSLGEYVCSPEENECKINLLVTPKLDGADSSDLTCEITADFDLISTIEPCNPNTSIVPEGEHVLTIKILTKKDLTLIKSSILTIKNIPEDTTIDPVRVTFTREWQIPTHLLSKEDSSLTEYTCDPAETDCKINLLVTPKLDDTESALLTCEITSDFELMQGADPCNPNTSIIPEGEYVLTIKILAKKDSTLLQTSMIIVKNIPEDKTIAPTRVVAELIFQQPTYLLEKDDTTRENYTCDTSQDSCKINLLVTPKLDGVESSKLFCSITTDFGFAKEDCNPDTFEVPIGEHSISITIKNLATGDTIQTRILGITRSVSVVSSGGGGGSTISMLDLSVVQVIIQSGLDTNFVCKTEMCTVNFLVEAPSAAICSWNFGSGIFETPETNMNCNPGYVKFPTDSTVSFTVADPYFSSNVFTKTFRVTRLQNKETKEDVPEKPCLECSAILQGKIQISAVLPNPPHADTVEWIELQNISSETLDLRTCSISDETKKYALTDILGPNKTLRLRQAVTGLSLGNSKETLTLTCSDTVIDTFSWNFPVPDGYILHRAIFTQVPEKVMVSRVIDGDTLEVLQNGNKTTVRLLGIDTPETVHPSKPVQEFGIEASNFTKKLTGSYVWITYDIIPVDLYGRRLGYIWTCPGDFSEESCTLFNEVILREGYGRMERRFPFARYQAFDKDEKEAKDAKKGLWGLDEVKKVMSELTQEEKDVLELEKEKEYLELQKELLLACEREKSPECDKKDIDWKTLTEKITTLSVSAKKSGKIEISGRTWENFPLKLEVYNGNILLETWTPQSDEAGEYMLEWIPRDIGNYRFFLGLQKENNEVTKEKTLEFVSLSPHFSTPLAANIILQGQITDNRWLDEAGIFHCRSRGSCSVNVTAETNREDEVSYLWIFPDGEISDEKNPTSLSVGYGQHRILLIAIDDITEETSIQTLIIDHASIPKKGKGSNTTKTKSYTLDLKETNIEGGGIPPEELRQKSTLKNLLSSVILVIFLAGMGYWTLLIRKP